MNEREEVRLEIEELEERIAPSNANFPPGQFPSGNPAHAPARAIRTTFQLPVRVTNSRRRDEMYEP